MAAPSSWRARLADGRSSAPAVALGILVAGLFVAGNLLNESGR